MFNYKSDQNPFLSCLKHKLFQEQAGEERICVPRRGRVCPVSILHTLDKICMFTFLKTKAGLCVVKSTFKLGHAKQTLILKFISKHFIKEGGGGI